MRLLLTGGTGFLGGAIVAQARAARTGDAFEILPTWHVSPPPAGDGAHWLALDLARPESIARRVADARPDVVLHTAVAIAPSELAPVIVEGSRQLARAARAAGAAFLHLSSDMVFDGASGPFDEASPLSPITDYGRAKAAAEQGVRAEHPEAFIARASLLYRLSPPDRALAHWLAGARRGAGHPLFSDEIRCPAHVDDVAAALLRLAACVAGGAWKDDDPRTLHLVGPRALSRYAFGCMVLDALGLDRALAVPGRSADSGLVRPRALHLLRRTTPRWLTDGLREPADALG